MENNKKKIGVFVAIAIGLSIIFSLLSEYSDYIDISYIVIILFFVGIVFITKKIKINKENMKDNSKSEALTEELLNDFKNKETKTKKTINKTNKSTQEKPKENTQIKETNLKDIIESSDNLENNDWLKSFNERLNNPIEMENKDGDL